MSLGSLAPSRRRNAWLIVLGAVIVVGAVMSFKAPTTAVHPSDPGLRSNYQSQQVAELQAGLPGASEQPALVVYSNPDGGPMSDAQLSAITSAAPSAYAPLAPGGRYVGTEVSPDHTVAVSTIMVNTAGTEADQKAVIDQIRSIDRTIAPGVAVHVTGGPAFSTDLGAVFNGADTTLLLATALVVALLLLITYRSPILWIIPLVTVGLASAVTTQLVALTASHAGIRVDDAASGITSVIVFGAGTDYALLLISRYRDQLRHHEDRFVAMRGALGATATSILSSGATVTISLFTLVLCQTKSLQAIGYSAGIGIVVAMAFALLVLPAALVLCGRKVFWPLVPRVDRTPSHDGRFWGRIGRAAKRRPGFVVVISVVFLAALSLGSIGATVGLSQTQQFTARPESVVGQEILARSFPAGSSEPAVIITNSNETSAVKAAALATPGVTAVTVGPSNGSITQLNATLAAAPSTTASRETIVALRSSVGAVPGANAIVGGTVATELDQKSAVARDAGIVIPLVLLIVLVVLLILLRSVVAAVLLVATVLATYFAALGASWLLFSHVLHYPALDNQTRLLAFIFLVALGVDYNIFLADRAKQETASLGAKDGMLRALIATGGVITSAGILLASVFAVLGVLPLVTLKQIGIIVGIGVLLDTLLVRTVLVPSLAFLLDRTFWWPSALSRPRANPGAEVVA